MNNVRHCRIVSDMARSVNVSFELAMACVGNYQGLGRDMADILRFVAERKGQASATQAAMLSNPDWKIQRKGIMDLLGKGLWRHVQHSCGNAPERIAVIAKFLLAED